MNKGFTAIFLAATMLLCFGCQNPSNSDSATATTYSVIYNGNGNTSGTAPTDSNKYESGKKVTVLANTLTKTAYSFTGWNTKADGSGDSYAPSTTFMMPANDVSLYAQWSALPTYNVAYDVNGGDASSAPVDNTGYLANTSAIVVTALPTRTDYLCIGWTLASDNSGTILKAGDSIAIASSNVTLYAVWSPKKFSMKLYDGSIENGVRFADSKPVDETMYRFTLVGYGSTTSGNYVLTNRDGTVYTGTFIRSKEPTSTTNRIGNVKTLSQYTFTLPNGDTVTVYYSVTTYKNGDPTYRTTNSTVISASTDSAKTLANGLLEQTGNSGGVSTLLEFAEF